MLQIKILGQFDVRLDGTLVNLPSRKAQLLLAKLALTTGSAHRREKLAGELWPDMAEADARGNLRHALWRIRAALRQVGAHQEFIEADAISITLTRNAPLCLDAHEFDRGSQQLRASTDTLIAIARCYTGPLLPGFYDDWSEAQRQRLQLAFDALMSVLIGRLSQESRWHDLMEWAGTWMTHSDYDDVPHHALTAVRLAMGEIIRAGASTDMACSHGRSDAQLLSASELRHILGRTLSRIDTLARDRRRALQSVVIGGTADPTPTPDSTPRVTSVGMPAANDAEQLLTSSISSIWPSHHGGTRQPAM